MGVQHIAQENIVAAVSPAKLPRAQRGVDRCGPTRLTLDLLLADFEQAVGTEKHLVPVTTFEDLIRAFDQNFSSVSDLIMRLNAILQRRGDPKAAIELEWIRSKNGTDIEGCIVTRRSGHPQRELPIAYSGGHVTLGDTDNNDRVTRSADADAVGWIISGFAKGYFR